MADPGPTTLAALSLAQSVAEAVATLAFALSGLIEAARKRLDAVGVVVVAGLAAFGGGTLRDILLDRRPFFWVQHAAWLWALLALCVAAMLFMRARHLAPTERAMQWPDALGLGLFCAGGTQVALAAQMPAFVAVLMGVVTAAFGGVLRDVVCNEVPRAFSDHRPYALCAFAGGWVTVGATAAGAAAELALVGGAVVATALRAGALAADYRLPAWRAWDDADEPRERPGERSER
ncbi:MAG: trimeric intracellular cation channel family protein [Rubrivivax sp.]|nr:trimeric intracellular cation channel family protein [Rubrivivax sp.]